MKKAAADDAAAEKENKEMETIEKKVDAENAAPAGPVAEAVVPKEPEIPVQRKVDSAQALP